MRIKNCQHVKVRAGIHFSVKSVSVYEIIFTAMMKVFLKCRRGRKKNDVLSWSYFIPDCVSDYLDINGDLPDLMNASVCGPGLRSVNREIE